MTAFMNMTAPEIVDLMEHATANTFTVMAQEVFREHDRRLAEMEQRLNEIKQKLGGD